MPQKIQARFVNVLDPLLVPSKGPERTIFLMRLSTVLIKGPYGVDHFRDAGRSLLVGLTDFLIQKTEAEKAEDASIDMLASWLRSRTDAGSASAWLSGIADEGDRLGDGPFGPIHAIRHASIMAPRELDAVMAVIDGALRPYGWQGARPKGVEAA